MTSTTLKPEQLSFYLGVLDFFKQLDQVKSPLLKQAVHQFLFGSSEPKNLSASEFANLRDVFTMIFDRKKENTSTLMCCTKSDDSDKLSKQTLEKRVLQLEKEKDELKLQVAKFTKGVSELQSIVSNL